MPKIKPAQSSNIKNIILFLSQILVIIILGAVIYSNTFNSSFHLDDYRFIVKNPAIRNIFEIKPLLKVHRTRLISFYSFALNYHFHQLKVFGYHLVNFLIHIFTSLFVWFFISNLLSIKLMNKYDLSNHNKTISFFAALIFLTHPIQTQAVTYITQRFSSLATFFYMLSLCFYLKGRLLDSRVVKKVIYFLLAGTVGLIGMFTKEIVITLPLAVLLIELMFFKRNNKSNKFLYWILIAVVLFSLLVVPYTYTKLNISYFLKPILSGSHQGDVLTPTKYILTQFRVFIKYLTLLFVPMGQNLDYDFPASKSIFELNTLFSIIFYFLILLAAIKYKSKNILISYGTIWIYLTLLPNFIPRHHVIFEHNLYLPSIGFSILASVGLYCLIKNYKIYIWVAILIIGILSILTFQRNNVWKNEITLWKDVVKKSPDKFRPNHSLGRAYLIQGKYKLAEGYLNKALKIKPESPRAYVARANLYFKQKLFNLALDDFNNAINLHPGYIEAYLGRGDLFYERKDYNKALLDYEKAESIDPLYQKTFLNRVKFYQELGLYDLALKDYNTLLRIDPRYVEGYCNRGTIYAKNRLFDLALKDYNRALKINPNFVEAYNNRGAVFIERKLLDSAIKDFNKAISLNPDNFEAYNNRGTVYFNKKEYEKAILDYKKALNINKKIPQAYLNIASIYKIQGKYDQAIEELNKLVEIDPENIDAYYNKGTIYGKIKKYDLAIRNFTKVLGLDPNNSKVYFMRSVAYKEIGAYKRALDDALHSQSLGYDINGDYIKILRKICSISQ